MGALLDFHRVFGYVAVVANALVGVYALAAWQWKSLRTKVLWICTAVAEGAMLVQVVGGTILAASKDYAAPRIHMFYGFLTFITIAMAYQYRSSMRRRLPMFYGLVGLFIMGLGIRAITQA
jgi:hypothetical protein